MALAWICALTGCAAESEETAKATDLVRPDGRIPFRLSAAAADVRLRLSGGIDKPVGQGDVALDMSVSGERFDKLNRLARASLPPWGPYSAAGRFRMSKQGYAVDDLVLGCPGKQRQALERLRAGDLVHQVQVDVQQVAARPSNLPASCISSVAA